MKSYVELNNGIQMPAVGLGTFLMAPPDAEEAVYNALKVGCRLIDTANAYLNERAVGPPLLPPDRAEGPHRRRRHPGPGLVSPGPRGQSLSERASVHGACAKVPQIQRADHFALAQRLRLLF